MKEVFDRYGKLRGEIMKTNRINREVSHALCI
jgi:hypothetical protein